MRHDGFPGQIHHCRESGSNFIVRIRNGYFDHISAGNVVRLTAHESDGAFQIVTGARSSACSLAQTHRANIPLGYRDLNQDWVEVD